MILLIGASASGKTEVAKLLKNLFGIKKAVTHTSRKPRPGEKDGIDYHFVSDEEFQSLYAEGKLLENTLYTGNHYGCSKAELSDDKCVILDPNGLKAFLAQNNPRLITFFLEASEETRRKRMAIRGDAPEAIE
ncbi:MAG: guanylate kinase, partial [Bacilli bacterium]|nr:guanylate kinase [Bacilli bacterium]